jgi:3-dehydroquinate dehydratase / shikimate dehydrogenase
VVSKLIVSLKGYPWLELQQQIQQAEPLADWIELRLDLMPHYELSQLVAFVQSISTPIIWTLRTITQGGDFEGTRKDYLEYLQQLLAWKPAWVDVEAWVTDENYQMLRQASPDTHWIVSWHQLPTVSEELEVIYQRLIHLPADYYKLTLTAHTATDSLKLLNFAKEKNRSSSHLCIVGMGKLGEPTRILAPLAKCPFTYSALNKGQETAPGQLTAHELQHVYHWKQLNENTELFGLIGRPVQYSISHVTHNAVFDHLKMNAVYAKFNLEDDELASFLEQMHQFNGKGLSVTTPFKEQVIAFLSQPISFLACNTLAWNKGLLLGTNTDGTGALSALGIPINNEKILIIGAGGAAKAIAQAAVEQGAQVVILNRTFSKAEALAQQISGRAGRLEDFKHFQDEGYLTVVQATSAGMGQAINESPLSATQLSPDSHVLEVISYPQETHFLKEARQQGCRVITGRELFIQQAVEQFVFWFGSQINRVLVEKVLREQVNQSAMIVHSSQLKGAVHLPPSKSHSIRAILLGALAQGTSSITHLLVDSLDIQAAIQAVKQLGAKVTQQEDVTIIEGVAGQPHSSEQIINVANSGQVLRFVGALAALAPGQTILTGDQSIRTYRSVQPLIEGIQQLGGESLSIQRNGFAPFFVKGPLHAGQVTLDGQDSQPVSALLMAAAFLEGTTHIHVLNAGEKPWLQLTLSWLDRLQVLYKHQNLESFEIKGTCLRPAFEVTIPGDWSAAAFVIVAALITQSTVVIEGTAFDDVQGDQAVVPWLQSLGAQFTMDRAQSQLTVHPSPILQGGTVNVNDFIDAVPILAVLGCFMKEDLILTHAEIARHKECNRLQCITTELKKMGAHIQETEDGLKISPSVLRGAIVKSYGDHRMALALIVAGLAAKGETIVQGTYCIQKSFPDFIKQLQQLGGYAHETTS